MTGPLPDLRAMCCPDCGLIVLLPDPSPAAPDPTGEYDQKLAAHRDRDNCQPGEDTL